MVSNPPNTGHPTLQYDSMATRGMTINDPALLLSHLQDSKQCRILFRNLLRHNLIHPMGLFPVEHPLLLLLPQCLIITERIRLIETSTHRCGEENLQRSLLSSINFKLYRLRTQKQARPIIVADDRSRTMRHDSSSIII